ncbi:MAG: phosphomevalonate kinase [Enterococcaceae bacterium]|jgi:phosphomevalonate kinase|nr:phosphomevalonate kinase [Enterococcaceae bacterium]MCI1919699.1 phosphomevalonate kinase [Enterococcaceae bacterium]
MIEASVPGKLYIAGEYAVVEPGYPAILVAVDQFITVRVNRAQQVGTIQSAQYRDLPVRWTRKNDRMIIDVRDNPFHYILAAIRMTEKFAKEKGRELDFFDLKVESELDSSNGRKYGLGSSGAVTVATVQVLGKFYKLDLQPLEVFKLAALAHHEVASNGSCGDLAASCFGGWLAFSTFDDDWLHQKMDKCTVAELLKLDWPKLSIEPLAVPKDLRLLIGWTGQPASTTNLVDQVSEAIQTHQEEYQSFLQASRACVDEMIRGFKADDIKRIQTMIRRNRALLQQLADFTGVKIEISDLTKMCELAEEFHGAAKSSGAGGGDCGIAILDKKAGILPLVSAWEKAEITPLPLHVYFYPQTKEENREPQRRTS